MHPEAHSTPSAMARVLVQYLSDPHEIRRIIKREFNDAPTVETIAYWRARHLQPSPPPLAFKVEEDRYFARMELANRAFVKALRAAQPRIERAA